MYDASVYDRTRASESYWESESPPLELPDPAPSDATAPHDVAILGGGYTGLSAAYHLAKHTALSVAVFESGKIGCGASGLNGGFCNVSPTRGPGDLCKRFGDDNARAYLSGLYEGVELVRALLRDENIDAQPQFGGTYEVAHSPAAYDRLAGKADLLCGRLGIEGSLVSQEVFETRGHRSPEQFGALHHPSTFGLNPLRYVRGLAAAAAREGVAIFENSPVERLDKRGAVHELTVGSSVVRAHRLIVATNAYTPERLHRQFTSRLMPVISQIVVTRPLRPEELDAQGWKTKLGCASTHATLFYYRMLPNGRLMFGGPGDTTGTPDDAKRNTATLVEALRKRFPAWANVEVTHSWRGLVCTSRKFAPSVGEAGGDPSVLYGLGYHGNGVAAATWTGRQLASVAAGSARLDEAFPVPMLGLSGKFPLPALRPVYLRAAIRLMRLRD